MGLLKERIDELVRSDPPGALAAADVLDRAARATPGTEALAARGRAMAKHANGRAADALPDYLEAARLHADDGDEREVGRVHRSLVDVYQMSGESERALASARTAREIFERLGERKLLAQLEANLGNVYVRLDDYPAARRHYVAACRLFEDERDELALAVTRYNLAVTETSANAVAEARRSFLGSRTVFEEHGMRVHTADCGYMLAYLEARRGRFTDAISDLERARELYAACGKPSGGPMCDLDLAEIYYRIDACRDALEHAERAAQGFARLGMDYERAKCAMFSGLAHARLGQADLALEELAYAHGTLVRLGNRAWPAVVDLHRSAIELSAPRTAAPDDRSLLQLTAARKALREQGLRLWESLATVAVARMHLARGDADRALEELLEVERRRGEGEELDGLVAMEQRVVLADVRRAQGDEDGAITALREAIEAIESTWSNVPGTDVRTAFFRTRHEVFAHLSLLLADRTASEDEAFEVLELGRLRSLKDARGWSGHRPRAETGETRRGADREPQSDGALAEARERLDWLLSRQLDEQLGPAGSDRDLQGPRIRDEDILEAQRDVARLSRSSDRSHALPGAREPVLPRLRESLDPDELLVTWIVTERDARMLLVGRDGASSVPLDADTSTVRDLADRLFFQLDKFELGPAYQQRHRARLLASIDAILGELADRLLGPAAGILARHPKLILVPYGPLHGLPLHALRPAGEPLVATHDVGYALSGHQLVASPSRPSGRTEVCVVGADTASLPAITAELEAIRACFGERTRRIPPQDLRAGLEVGAAAGSLLHVSAHGSFQPAHPVFSGIRLGETFLTAHDIAPLDLPYDVVCLSGCETGRLGHTAGEELFGLARALLGAGTGCVVSSLWSVGDTDCAAFMDHFYRHLGAGEEVRAAVSAAQRERLREDPHPFTWAAFTATGDPRVRCPGATGAALAPAERARATPPEGNGR